MCEAKFGFESFPKKGSFHPEIERWAVHTSHIWQDQLRIMTFKNGISWSRRRLFWRTVVTSFPIWTRVFFLLRTRVESRVLVRIVSRPPSLYARKMIYWPCSFIWSRGLPWTWNHFEVIFDSTEQTATMWKGKVFPRMCDSSLIMCPRAWREF